MLHQEALLRRALDEQCVSYKTIKLNHLAGTAKIIGIPNAPDRDVGLIYPRSFFEAAEEMMANEKKLPQYFFQGHCPTTGSRVALFNAFKKAEVCRSQVQINRSKFARQAGNKGKWDRIYFLWLARAQFGLCPHHLNFPAQGYGLWTYRFVDCCMVGALPVLFRETPLCAKFIEGFHVLWNDDTTHTYNRRLAIQNRQLAQERFSL